MASRAEILGVALAMWLAVTIVTAYLADAAGAGVWPIGSASLGVLAAFLVLARARRARPDPAAMFIFVVTLMATIAYLLTLSAPGLMPPGGGPDLTHHLTLVDFIARHGTLVHDPGASHQLGEMANYTPGLHTLAAAAATIAGTDGVFTIYPIVVISVAVKFALFALVLMRLSVDKRLALPAALLGIAILLNLRSLTVHPFTHDSFLAQVVSELFAVTMLWTLVAWAKQPNVFCMAIFGVTAAAAFLTWPLWVGPLGVGLGLVLASTSLPPRMRVAHALVAGTPVLLVATLHAAGRLGAAAIVGTSGAVAPALTPVAWAIAVLVPIGAAFAVRRADGRPLVWVLAALVLQALALWFAARVSAAATPYMAIKMSYLGVYVATAIAVIAIPAMTQRPWVMWSVAVLLSVNAVREARHDRPTDPIVDEELQAAGMWARAHVPSACVDYLVRNENTAYWLHLAVLGNARMSERSRDDSLYFTEPSFARWIEGARQARYAIARRSVLPAEIRDRTRVLYEKGDAIVIERLTPMPAGAADTCAGFPR